MQFYKKWNGELKGGRAGRVDASHVGKKPVLPCKRHPFIECARNWTFTLYLQAFFPRFSIRHKNGGLINYLLTELSRARRENIWLSVTAHGHAALGTYVMASSQIISRLTLPIIQQAHSILVIYLIPTKRSLQC